MRLVPHLLFLVPELLIATGPFVIQTVTDAAGRPRFRMPDFFYGGQALIEGVMMRGKTSVAMSVRHKAGDIRTFTEPLPAALRGGLWMRIPFIRGAFVLYETLILGTRMLMRSAAIAAEGDDIELGKGTIAITMSISLVFAVGLFFVLPLLLSGLAEGAADSDIIANLVEGVVRLVILIAYVSLIGLMPEVRRTFAYHGAEHKAISTNEAREPLTPESVARFSTAHTRCGTTFILIVVVVSILVFTLIPRAGVPLWLLIISRIVFVPIIAAFSYELVRFGARHYGNGLVRALYAPGLWLQKLTTREPDHGMLEVSIASLEKCLESDRDAAQSGGAKRGDKAEAAPADVVDPTVGLTP